jgi:hypothetical protein
MINIFTIESEYESALRLGFTTHKNVEKKVEIFNKDINIRWGNSNLLLNKYCEYEEFKYVVNPAENIRRNCRKHESLKRLSKVVHTPKLFEDFIPDKELVVVRPVEHTGGKEFSVKTGPFYIEKYYEYATSFIKTKTEYRVWFCNGNTMCAWRARSSDKSEYPNRAEWGYIFCDISPNLHKQTLLAAKCLGLELGAADVLAKNGHFYFLELNSAPSIDLMRIETFFRENIYDLVYRKFPNVK